NAALLSRCRVFTLKALTEEQIITILQRALHDKERGLGQLPVYIDDDALQQIAVFANGDARTALNVLELAAQGNVGARSIMPIRLPEPQARTQSVGSRNTDPVPSNPEGTPGETKQAVNENAPIHITLGAIEDVMQHRA